jgi:acyl dehydratase
MNQSKNQWPSGVPAVGQRAERSREVLMRDIELFTAISGDHNPLHYDEDIAKETTFGEIIVQGGITSAILNAVVAEDLPGPGTVFLNVDWNFRAPVRPGDVITGRVEVLEVRSDKPVTKLKTTVTRDDGTVALEGKAICYTVPLPSLYPNSG